MSIKTLIAKLPGALSFYSGKSSRLTDLMQYLKDKDDLLNKRIEQCNLLKRKLTFIHHTLLNNKGSMFRLELDEKNGFLLGVSNYSSRKKNIIIFLLEEEKEVVSVFTQVIDDILVINEIVIDFILCDISIGKFIVEHLIGQAETSGAAVIVGSFNEVPNISFSEQELFFKQIGFQVIKSPAEGYASISYSLSTAQHQ